MSTARSSGRSSGKSSGSKEWRSTRSSKPVNKFDQSHSPTTPRTHKRKSRTSLLSTVRNTGSIISGKMLSLTQTVRPVLNESWAKRPLGPPRHPRSESRTSTRTRAASLEKMQRAGSIKINHSIISKSGYRAEEVGQRVGHTW